jgi:hypothetical protein
MAHARIRFTIASLMAIVLLVAVAFAALRNANEFWSKCGLLSRLIAVKDKQ